MASLSRRTYTGMSGDLQTRVWQHKNGEGSVFTKKYNINRLVWYDETNDALVALEWEKRIKKWRREKKIKLIEETNPDWLDLSENWFDNSND